jgi:hypothetical protein
VLCGQRFEAETDCATIGRIAEALISRINTSARHVVPDFQGINRDKIIEDRQDSGQTIVQVHMADELALASGIAAVKLSTDGTILENSEDQIRAQQAKEVGRLVALQEAHPDLGAAIKYLQDEPDMYGLYKAYEAIRALAGRETPGSPVSLGWTSKAELNRFTGSAQLDRHHRYSGPEKPMSLREAYAFVRDLLAKLITHLDRV